MNNQNIQKEQSKKELEIINTIKAYIDENIYYYAMMIDGKWGTGKTWFIEERIMKDEEIIKDKKIIKISLYGITSEEEIARNIFYQCNPIAKAGIFIERVLSSVKFTIPVLGIEINETDFNKLIKNIDEKVKKNNVVLIFDDLERCGMDINKTMGYINGFVEGGYKTIIIADEGKIEKSNFTDNLELKYMVAADSSIVVSKKAETSKDSKEYNDDSFLSIEDIKDRMGKLFFENAIYSEIKEKIVGKTIKFEPDLMDVLNTFVNDGKFKLTENAKLTLKRNLKVVVKIMEDYPHYNLRTLQAIIGYFNTICRAIENEKINEKYYNNLLEKCIFATIRSKDRVKYEDTLEPGDSLNFITNLVYHSNMSDKTICKFVTDYIKNQEEKRKREEEERKRQEKYQEKRETDPISYLDEWWIYEENIIKDKIKELIERFKQENEYNNILIYPLIILRLSELIGIGFNNYIDEVFPKMLKKIEKVKDEYEEISFDAFEISFPAKKRTAIFNKYFIQLKNASAMVNNKIVSIDINSMFEKENWASEFVKYCNENRDLILEMKRFWCNVENKVIIEKIRLCKNADLWAIRKCFYRMYKFSEVDEYFKEDMLNLKEFRDGLETLAEDENDLIKKSNIELLQKELTDIIKSLGK